MPQSEYERAQLPTLSRLSDDDVDHIWATVSCFIERLMLMRKGVYIIGLGTFTFSDQKLKQRPIFILSEKHCHNHGFKQIKLQCSDVPVVPLNFSALSVESQYERDTVEGCVRETVFLLLRSASKCHFASHTFPRIGVLTFKQTRVKMFFYRDFISALDATGKLSSALSSRPESNSCKASERQNSRRPATTSSIGLPRISAGEPRRPDLRTEQPDEAQNNGQEIQRSTSSRHIQPTATEIVNFTDRPLNGCPSNTDRGLKVSQPAEDTRNIMTVQRPHTSLNMMCQDHRRAGQELCYVCMQRAQRNIPLYVSDERRRAEQEQEQVLMLHEHQKDLQYFKTEEMDRLKIRADSQQVAAFNLRVAEAQRHRKSAAASSQSQGSYIFVDRPCTPNRLLQQRNYMQELLDQTARRRQLQMQTKQEQQQLDKLHQLQLCEEITLQQSQALHDKHETSSMYRKALQTQSEDRRTEPMCHHADPQPMFGLMDSDPAASAEQRHRAQNISVELMTTNLSRKREELLKRLNGQKREQEILQTDHREMLEERIRHYEKVRHLQAACEKNWQDSVVLRRQREQEELDFRRLAGQTLTDQLKKYERCSRCKRNTANCGETNVFRDTNYVSGSRLML